MRAINIPINLLWGWREDRPALREEAIQFYLGQFNGQARTRFDLAWAQSGIQAALASETCYHLACAAKFLPDGERGTARLPRWMENLLEGFTNGKMNQVLQDGWSAVG